MKTHIKICGITRLEDALLAESLGASAVGFVFYHKSPRYITPEKAGFITGNLGPFIGRVGVFVDEDFSSVIETARTAHLTAVQLHGSEDPVYAKELKKYGLQVIKAFRIDDAGNNFDPEKMSEYDINTFLFDTYSSNRILETGDKGNETEECYGGTGKTFDWGKINTVECGKYRRIILAGGLNASNVQEAIRIVKPWAVDVSSGVEISSPVKKPGIKDPDKMKAFFNAVKK
ncbi:MAG TPA: phosphoribosylanthranilate isomerase [bacterium]|nr:phosphoribosylanthranilate isomerase [bacterium]